MWCSIQSVFGSWHQSDSHKGLFDGVAHSSLARYGYRQNRNHMGNYRELLFHFHHVPVSSQHCKRAQRDLSMSVRKCTQERS